VKNEERADGPSTASSSSNTRDPSSELRDIKLEDSPDPLATPSKNRDADSKPQTPVERRAELFEQGPDARRDAVRRYYTLMLPTLVDVYAASVSVPVRSRAVQGMLKIVNFCDPDDLAKIMTVRFFA
jgi:E3 ubiquitin-protein ligase TRIP12